MAKVSDEFEVWISSLRDGQIVYECEGRFSTKPKALEEACDIAKRERVLLVEIKREREVVWALNPSRYGKYRGRLRVTYSRAREQE